MHGAQRRNRTTDTGIFNYETLSLVNDIDQIWAVIFGFDAKSLTSSGHYFGPTLDTRTPDGHL